MAQLKLTLSTQDVTAIRGLARARGLSVSVLLRDAVLGEPVDQIAPDDVQRLDHVDERLERLHRRVDALEQGTDVDGLDRRLTRLEEMAGL
jgi:hypothetical protein